MHVRKYSQNNEDIQLLSKEKIDKEVRRSYSSKLKVIVNTTKRPDFYLIREGVEYCIEKEGRYGISLYRELFK